MSTIFKFNSDVDTDQIIASQYLLLPNIDEMKGHAFESLDGNFAKEVKPGDIIVADENFGCGSRLESICRLRRRRSTAQVLPWNRV